MFSKVYACIRFCLSSKNTIISWFFNIFFYAIFLGKEADEDRDTQYYIHTSYVEIYNEEIRDLLSDNPEKKLEIKGNAVQGKCIFSKQVIF